MAQNFAETENSFDHLHIADATASQPTSYTRVVNWPTIQNNDSLVDEVNRIKLQYLAKLDENIDNVCNQLIAVHQKALNRNTAQNVPEEQAAECLAADVTDFRNNPTPENTRAATIISQRLIQSSRNANYNNHRNIIPNEALSSSFLAARPIEQPYTSIHDPHAKLDLLFNKAFKSAKSIESLAQTHIGYRMNSSIDNSQKIMLEANDLQRTLHEIRVKTSPFPLMSIDTPESRADFRRIMLNGPPLPSWQLEQRRRF